MKKSVNFVDKNTLRKKIIIGLVELINQNGLMWCGGAVERPIQMQLDAFPRNIKVRKMKRMLKRWLTIKTILKRSWFARVVIKRVIWWLNVLLILTIEQSTL